MMGKRARGRYSYWASDPDSRRVDVTPQIARAGGIPIGNTGVNDTHHFTMRNPNRFRARLELWALVDGQISRDPVATVSAAPLETLRVYVGFYNVECLRGKWVDERTEAEKLRDAIRDARRDGSISALPDR